MKQLTQLLLAIAMVFSLSSFAYSGTGLYVGGDLGLSFADDVNTSDPDGTISLDTGLALGGYVGYSFENNLRVEGEISYQGYSLDKMKFKGDSSSYPMDGTVGSVAFMANGYYDFKNSSIVTPFVGAGVGFATVAIENDSYGRFDPIGDLDDNDTVFAYQLTAGVGIDITERITLDVKYRYFATQDVDLENTTAEYSSNNIYTGIRFSF